MLIKDFLKSVGGALAGIYFVFKHENNFRIQFFAAIFAMSLAIFLPLTAYERLLLLIMCFMVLITEILNTAVERFVDLLAPRLHHYAKTVKDLMAGAVLMTSLCALAVGIAVFLPHIISWFR